MDREEAGFVFLVAGLGSMVLVLVVSGAGFIKIMNNDLAHVKKSLEDIIKNQTMIWEKVDKTAERIATIEGICKGRADCK